jgi:Na+-transporting methylmalonyl-CoA/oxaloacetate decarboxylase gamma subunit
LSDMQNGLMISVVGLLITFSALLIFIGVMVLLQKLFPVKKVEQTELVQEEIMVPTPTKDNTRDEEIAAALAAVTYLRARRSGQLGTTLVSGPGPYRTLKMVDRR